MISYGVSLDTSNESELKMKQSRVVNLRESDRLRSI